MRLSRMIARRGLVAFLTVTVLCGCCFAASNEKPNLVFSCSQKNDLYEVLKANLGQDLVRYDSPDQAIKNAPQGAGVMILADKYPDTPTAIEPALYEQAAAKKLRLYVEFPAALPGMEVGNIRDIRPERGVITSKAFGDSLPPMTIIAIQDAHFVDVAVKDPHIVIARVAGFDKAVYGLPAKEVYPILFNLPGKDVLVSTTKLSHFVTARYVPKESFQTIWKMIFDYLQPGNKIPTLQWTMTVHPSYTEKDKLPADAERQAIIRGIDWNFNARMLVDKSWKDQVNKPRLFAHNKDWVCGDGSCGLLEGVGSVIDYQGNQKVAFGLRSDCNGESALAFALRAQIDGDPRSLKVASNLQDWCWDKLVYDDPSKPVYGLLKWTPENGLNLYQENDVKVILGCIGTSALLKIDRWDERLLTNILANFRTTGVLGFRGERLNSKELLTEGWEYYWNKKTTRFSPHFEAWTWAAYLWLYDKTKWQPLLDRTKTGIRLMMEMYPDNWFWTNGLQQERTRMLLTLAWLIRVDDTPEHREWLQRIFKDVKADQVACGAIRERLGTLETGCFKPPKTNAGYGRNEAPLIQENGDPLADMLYTCNFALLGLHEAAAVTGDPEIQQVEDKLVEFLIRIQVRSEIHPELDGAWFRGFDFAKWDYWASNSDVGWGAWSVESGWTQGWVPAVMAMRLKKINLWDMTKDSKIARFMDKVRPAMLPDDKLTVPGYKHDAIGKPVVSFTKPVSTFRGLGALGLTDGLIDLAVARDAWMGYLGENFEAVVDMQKPTAIKKLAATFFQSNRDDVYLPVQVEFAVSDDGKEFKTVATVKPAIAPSEAGPLTSMLASDKLDVTARYVRVKATNIGKIPDSKDKDAYMFVDEILVNPAADK